MDDVPASGAQGSVGLPPEMTSRAPDVARGPRFESMDRMLQAVEGRLTAGLSPAALWLSYLDWAMHLANAPGKQAELLLDASAKLRAFIEQAYATSPEQTPPLAEAEGDHRFVDPLWRKPPFSFYAEAFLLTQQWWHEATTGVAGVSPHHTDVVSFAARQLLDVISPANLPMTNPEVLKRCFDTGGANLAEGLRHLCADLRQYVDGRQPAAMSAFRVGETLAATAGKVVYRNHLIELIQYAPATPSVFAEPILVVPAWIMKYYILDLSPKDSLVRFLVQQGHTVFCISWRNVTAQDRDLSLEDYRQLGIVAALDAIGTIMPEVKTHAIGYCLGGTLLAIAAAAMARSKDQRLASLSFLAAQTDFTEPGELQLFIDHSQVNFLEGVMREKGFLAAEQMAGAFNLLRSNDLIWSRMVRDYLLGERMPMNDLMAWNADATRMPYRMHAEYLNKLFLGNDLASGRYMVDGRAVSLQNIRVPIFAVGAERDHVAPWKSVYKLIYLTRTDITFLLTSSGHNAGIVSEPGHAHRHYHLHHQTGNDPCVDAQEWLAAAPVQDGSWWLAWAAWLESHSSPERVPPPPMGAADRGYPPLADAPGTYVFQT